ncbi:interleukin-34 isoform X2 [Ornithorhynchus anatinus]|uniref:interleukin-34 isoform X2 n=1 Tax=Ornithorhynchus anatinus TaxID=9258 RepID=UPI000454317F|nr:interleukin-34 isoform X2 [Ornithorhynchus anatinus]
MLRGCVGLLYVGIFLGAVLGSKDTEEPSRDECLITGILRKKLQYENRLLYTKRYFPIDYRIGVPYGMVLRLANVTRLKAEVAVSTQRLLWASVSLDALSAIQEVLMEEHPSWNYISEIILLLSTVKQNVVRNPMDTATHSLASSRVPDSGRKPVRPKALLDNCFRVMELLYWSCCKQNSTRDWDVCGRRAPETGPIAV